MKVRYNKSWNGKPQSNFTEGNEYEIDYIDACGDYWVYDNNNESVVLLTSECTVLDSILESVINQFRERSEVGIKKYGVTLDRTDLSTLDWINHAQQELMDGILYLEKLKQTL
jgi:hypothetical protein